MNARRDYAVNAVMTCLVDLSHQTDNLEPTANLVLVINSLGDGASQSVCRNPFHSACPVSAEHVAGWGLDSEGKGRRIG